VARRRVGGVRDIDGPETAVPSGDVRKGPCHDHVLHNIGERTRLAEHGEITWIGDVQDDHLGTDADVSIIPLHIHRSHGPADLAHYPEGGGGLLDECCLVSLFGLQLAGQRARRTRKQRQAHNHNDGDYESSLHLASPRVTDERSYQGIEIIPRGQDGFQLGQAVR
jgi:hypothetical protein